MGFNDDQYDPVSKPIWNPPKRIGISIRFDLNEQNRMAKQSGLLPVAHSGPFAINCGEDIRLTFDSKSKTLRLVGSKINTEYSCVEGFTVVSDD